MRSLKEILSENELCFPIDIQSENIITDLRRIYKKYNKFVKSIIGENRNITLDMKVYSKITNVEQKILSVISSYLDGNVITAYNSFKYLMPIIDDVLKNFKLLERTENLLPYKELYRIRLSGMPSIKRKDIFHVPYNKRRKVNSFRFSIPGNPALYLGTSAYICWEEMGRPSLDDVHISRFVFVNAKKMNLLNISLTNKLLLSYLKEFPEEEFDERITVKALTQSINSFFILWPLIASCQMKVKEKELPFKPEYIIPQLLMQHVQKNNEIDGIIFSSTRVEVADIEPNKTINIVFPAKKQIGNNEFCLDLVEKLHMTEPLSCKLYRTAIHKGMIDYKQKEDFEIVSGLKTFYSMSDFGIIEAATKKMKPEKV